MSMIFRFRTLCDENDRFLREYDVVCDMNLLEFHNFICLDLEFDPEQMTSFFASDGDWTQKQEYTMFDMGEGREDAPRAMETTTIRQVINSANNKLIYRFDIVGDRSLYMELSGMYESQEVDSFPKVATSNEEAPDQFEAGVLNNSSIFDEVMGEFNDFEGDEYYDD